MFAHTCIVNWLDSNSTKVTFSVLWQANAINLRYILLSQNIKLNRTCTSAHEKRWNVKDVKPCENNNLVWWESRFLMDFFWSNPDGKDTKLHRVENFKYVKKQLNFCGYTLCCDFPRANNFASTQFCNFNIIIICIQPMYRYPLR